MSDVILGAPNYTPVDVPILRTLVVCKSNDLPDKTDRVKDTVYLVYDKMELHIYQSLYRDPFCIVESLGEYKEILTDKMLYITMEGEMYSVSNHVVYHLGSIAEESMKDLLVQCGTIYFMNAESRYFDKQKRILLLPFQNGTYQLSLSLAKDIKIDEDTVIRYDPEKEQFYIAGKEYQFDNKLNNIYRYSGLASNTVLNEVDDHTFKSKVRVSDRKNNDIKVLKNGLFVSTNDLATQENYLHMIETFTYIKMRMDGYIRQLKEALANAQDAASAESLMDIAEDVLELYKADIDDMYDSYDTLYERLQAVENSIGQGFDQAINDVKEEIEQYINQTNTAWEPELQEPIEPEDPENTGVNNFNVDDGLKGMVLSSFRKSLITLRDNETDYSNGMTEEEVAIQNEVLENFYNIASGLESGIDETSI